MTEAKNLRLLILPVVLAFVAAVVVAGCGGGGGSTGTVNPGGEEGTTPATQPGAGQGEGTKEEGSDGEEMSEGESGEEGEEAEEMSERAEGESGGAEAEAGGAALTAGKEVFSSNCSSCHTLKEAGASGAVGPNLDELEPDMATVEHQVINGGGGMPAFKGQLSSEEIKSVATYVSSVAGTE